MRKIIKVNTGDDTIIFDKLNFGGIIANTLNGAHFVLFLFNDGNMFKRECHGNITSTSLVENLKKDSSFKEILNDNEIIMLDNNEGLFIKKYLKENLQFFRVKNNAQFFTIGFLNGNQLELHSASSQSIGDLEKVFKELN